MAPVKGPHNESYQEFYTNWSNTQVEHLKELEQALSSNMRENELKALVEKAKAHYEYYYGAKDNAARQSVLQVMSPSWKTPLETAFMWIGGWRPTLIFQLAYALAGQQVEAELAELLAGVESPTMASLSARQLEKINEMQVAAQKQEDDMSHQMAVMQQGMADQPFVGIVQTQVLSQLRGQDGVEDPMEGPIEEKLKQLEELLIQADNMRKETLSAMLDILSPVQAAQFLVAAAQLQVAFREIGEMRDAADRKDEK